MPMQLVPPAHPAMALDDDRLIQAAIDGEEGAFPELVERYLPRIYRFLGRLVGWSWAEDLTQEVFLRAYERRRSYRPASGSFNSWIHGIARNLAIDFHRRKKPVVSMDTGRRDRSESGRISMQLVDQSAAEPSDRLAAGETRAALERAIGELAEPFRTAVVLCVLEGFSYEEAAAVEGCPAKTISSRLARGRAALRKALAEELDQEAGGPRATEGAPRLEG